MKKLFLGFLFVIPSFAFAAITTGNELNEYITQPTGDFGNGIALGFISAVAEMSAHSTDNTINGIKYYLNLTPDKQREMASRVVVGKMICIPGGVTRGQLMAVVKKWLSTHPEKWNEDAHKLVQEALKTGFPCTSVDELLR